MVTLYKKGDASKTPFVYKTLNDACAQNGSTYGRNRTSAVKYLTACGFDMTGIEGTHEGTKGPKGESTHKPGNVMDKIIAACSTPDKKLIAGLNDKLHAEIQKLDRNSSLEPIYALKDQIAQAEKPEINRDKIVAYVLSLFLEWCTAHNIDPMIDFTANADGTFSQTVPAPEPKKP